MFCFPNSDQVMFSREFTFCLSLIMHTHACGCTCIRPRLKETVLWGIIMWSEMGKQNIQAWLVQGLGVTLRKSWGTSKNESSRCQICNFLCVGRTFRSKTNGKEFSINYNLNCNSKNVVYLIICKIRCVAFSNVGSTTTTFRFNNHRSCLQKIGGMLPGFLYQHFLSSEHLGLKHISIQLIDRAIGERELGDKEGQ